MPSCSKDYPGSPEESEPNIQDEYTEQEFGKAMVLGEKLNNPYSISNMRATYDSLMKTKSGDDADFEQLVPNCLYVRFLPKDSTDVSVLQDLDLELFDYPLDYDIAAEGDIYHDPSIPEDELTWQYTTVNTNFQFPDMEYEILQECYIPEESDDTKAGVSSFAQELELAAIENADLPEKYLPEADTKGWFSGKYPQGRIRIANDSKSTTEGLRGVKVRCHYFVNISSAYTGNDGSYYIPSKYVCNPHYAIVFDNEKGFTIWGNFAFLAAANDNMGYQDKAGYDKKIECTDNAWKWGVINNAAYDFYNMCTSGGLMTPPKNLKIWCWPNASSSSAPMLRHMVGINSTGPARFASFLLTGNVWSGVAAAVTALVSMGLPDITIGMTHSGATPNSYYNEHYYTVWHELFHASHFAKAGSTLWAPYINYIVIHGGYGDGTDKVTAGKNMCELGESWAYANEYYSANQRWNSSWWFSKSVTSIKALLDNKVLTRMQMYGCLTKDVKSIDDFKNKLVEKYPEKSSSIYAAFE